MKRTVVAAAIGSVGIAAMALTAARKRDVTADRASSARAVTVRRNPSDLYALWRDPARFAQFFRGVAGVERLDDGRERWTLGGRSAPVDVTIVEDQPGRLFEWRTAPYGPYSTRGTVSFVPAPAREATEVRMSVALSGPAARVASAFARLFGASTAQIAMESLRNFKALAEAGEIPKAVWD